MWRFDAGRRVCCVNSVADMSQTAQRHRISDVERFRAVSAARERFLAGDDRVRGVRPEVATSWYRCREQYHVDPGLSQAPAASAQDESSAEHALEHEIVFAQLGGAAASIASEVESVGGVVTVTDGAGRILTVQGDRQTLSRARDSNMAPWWPRPSPRHARGPDKRSPPWTQAARSSSPTRRQASSSASPRGCRRWTPQFAGGRAWTSGAWPITPSSRLGSTTAGS